MSKEMKNNSLNEPLIKFTKSKISKIIQSISTTDTPKYLFENLNKLFLSHNDGEEFIINLFSIK